MRYIYIIVAKPEEMCFEMPTTIVCAKNEEEAWLIAEEIDETSQRDFRIWSRISTTENESRLIWGAIYIDSYGRE